MQPADFLKNLIEDNSEYILSDEDKKVIQHEGIETFIFNKLNSSKYRASSTTEDYLQKVKDKIHLSVMHDLPIHVTLPFGAAKNPYLPTAPNIDCAEVFNIAYFRKYLKPIAKAYKHGVDLHYVSVSVFEEKVNRIPKEDTDKYDKEFTSLLDVYREYLPSNLTLSFSRVEDIIPRQTINKLIEIKMEELKKGWNKQSKEVIDYKLLRAARNSVWKESDPHKDALILNSALGHDAFCSECWTTDVAPWDKKDMITLAHNYTTGWAIHVRSCSGSSVNFWSGMGVLKAKNDSYTPTVLSPRQYKEVKSSSKEVEVDIFGGKYKNLGKVSVI